MKKAIYEGTAINVMIRWGKNGKKYVWENPTQEQVDYYTKKYGCDQIGNEGWLWLAY